MLRTYKAILHGDHVEWIDGSPDKPDPIEVHITLLEGTTLESSERNGKKMAKALADLADRNAFADISDPIEWQRAERNLIR